MNKKIAGLILASILILGMIGTMTWAFFSDSEHAANNLLTAGTLDLKTNDADGVSLVLSAPRLKPDNSFGPVTIALRNAGLLAASFLDITFSYLESDGQQNNTLNMSADAVAEIIEVTTLTYGVTDLLIAVPDFNANAYRDIVDLQNASFSGQAGLEPNESKDFVMAIRMQDGINNNFQGDGIDIVITFNLRQ